MTATPIVTLVTPTYNQCATLAATLDCVLAQTYPAIDYRVIDDGSTDDTPAVLARYNGRIAWDRQANMGQAATLNRAWSEGKGKYLAFLSSDDRLAPNAIARLVSVLEADPRLACVYPDCDLIDLRGRILARSVSRSFDLAALVVQQYNPIGPGAVFRADAFARAGGWRTDLVLGVDDDFWIRMERLGGIAFLPEPLASSGVHSRSISRKRTSEARASGILTVVREYFTRSDVPAAIRARESEAWANAHSVMARRLLRALRIGPALHHRLLAAHHRARMADPIPARLRPNIPRIARLRVLRAATWG